MNSIRLLAVSLVLGICSMDVVAARAETPYEPPIQYALEHLTSGIATSSLVNGTKVAVKPLRTWKSVSGHYCRQYELAITEPSAATERAILTRCRNSDGIWKSAARE